MIQETLLVDKKKQKQNKTKKGHATGGKKPSPKEVESSVMWSIKTTENL